eukprot:12877645-Alexandrium_andersonii.AAC.1
MGNDTGQQRIKLFPSVSASFQQSPTVSCTCPRSCLPMGSPLLPGGLPPPRPLEVAHPAPAGGA